jgi:hypothetical protein
MSKGYIVPGPAMQRHLEHLDARVYCDACGWCGPLGKLLAVRLNDFHRLRGRERLEAIGRAMRHEHPRCHCGNRVEWA